MRFFRWIFGATSDASERRREHSEAMKWARRSVLVALVLGVVGIVVGAVEILVTVTSDDEDSLAATTSTTTGSTTTPEEETEPYALVIERNMDRIPAEPDMLGGRYVVDRSIDALPAPPSDDNTCVGRYEWAAELGAIVADALVVEVRVEATSDSLVTIDDIRPRVVERRAPTAGAYISCPGQGGRNEIAYVRGDLDEDPVAVATYVGEELVPFDFEASASDAQVFQVAGHTFECDCEWVIDVRLIVAGETYTETITNGDEPFRTTSSWTAQEYWWIDGRWQPPPGVDGAGSTSSSVPGSSEEACLLDAGEVEAVVGAPVAVTGTIPRAGPGATGITIEHTSCTYAGPNGVVTLVSNTAPSAAEAAAEYDVVLANYGAQGDPVPLDGIGDEAHRVGAALLARRGAEIFIVQAPATTAAGEVALLAARRWA